MDIKKILNENSIDIKQFARSLYVTERTVYNWINGGTIPPEKIRHIKDVYGELPSTQSETDTPRT
jgi:DNA-binding transcriptional regulator YiaG